MHSTEMSLEAFRGGDEHWGCRFVSYALHSFQALPVLPRFSGTFVEVLRGVFEKRARTVLDKARVAYDNYFIIYMYSK